MGETATMIVFYILAAVMIACSVFAVTSRRMMRSATALFFVLIGTAGFYLLLNYHFLAAVQLAVYAGGVMVLFLFAIMLTSTQQGQTGERRSWKRIVPGALTALAGMAVVAFAFLKHKFVYASPEKIAGDYQIPMKEIGHALMGTGKFQYLLPFEVLSVMLLACIIGGILIARKR